MSETPNSNSYSLGHAPFDGIISTSMKRRLKFESIDNIKRTRERKSSKESPERKIAKVEEPLVKCALCNNICSENDLKRDEGVSDVCWNCEDWDRPYWTIKKAKIPVFDYHYYCFMCQTNNGINHTNGQCSRCGLGATKIYKNRCPCGNRAIDSLNLRCRKCAL
jgi:hypothetical protein